MTLQLTGNAAPASTWERVRLGILFAFLILVFLGGGASRSDVLSLLYLRPAAVLCAMFLLLTPGRLDLDRVRVPLLFLAALALLIIVQLIPLPPDLWIHLPGHRRFAEAAVAAGLDQPWRPLSISPYLSLNSLVSLVVPAAVLIGIASVTTHGFHRLLLIFLLSAAVGSAILGIAQISGGRSSVLYLYRVTNEGLPVGFFANRNHQAALIACAFPMLAAWACLRRKEPKSALARRWLAGLIGAFLIPLIVVTGSRSGVVLAALGLLSALLIFWVSRTARPAVASARNAVVELAPWILGFGFLLMSVLLSRAPAIQRFLSSSVTDDRRIQDLDLFVKMAKDFLPLGAGFGTFDPLFRVYEPYEHLRLQYLNHAHNDLMELVITAGVFGPALLIGFVLWWLRRSLDILRRERRGEGVELRITGSAIILILLVASIFDYPLRTPIMMVVLAIAATWLDAGTHGQGVKAGRNPSNALRRPVEALSTRPSG